MKVMTIFGTRPEIIRLSQILPKLDKHFEHVMVYTGQNFDKNLKDVFFRELNLRMPDYDLNQEEKVGFEFLSMIFKEIPSILEREKPDAVLILGDVTGAISSYIVKMKGIPLFHMEAGNRCYSDEVPEEVNRRVIDSLSDYLLPYTQRSREQLIVEGYHPSKIVVTGNPIVEVLKAYDQQSNESKILEELELKEKEFIAVTFHRHENVTNEKRLRNIIEVLEELSKKYKVVVSTHPKTQEKLRKMEGLENSKVNFLKPFGLFDFLKLEKTAKGVITDSGTVPEECSIYGTPCVLVRTSTERPELLESGGMVVSGIEKEDILTAFNIAINSEKSRIPEDYKDFNVSDKIVKLLMRYEDVRK